LTLNIDGVPVYHTLPETAVDGDICLYSPANTLNASDSAKRIHIDWKELCKALAVADAEFNINFSSADGNICGQLYATSFNGEEGTDKFFQYTNGNEEWQLSFRNDVFIPDESIYSKNEELIPIDTLPESFILPVFTSTDTEFNDINGDIFYAPLKLTVYRGGWYPLITVDGNPVNGEYITRDEFSSFISNLTYVIENLESHIAQIDPSLFATQEALNHLSMMFSDNLTQLSEGFSAALNDTNARIDDVAGGSDEIELTAETATLQPNKHYKFGEVESLTLDFAEGNIEKVNEYMFSFISSVTPTILTLPSSVQWANELTVEANKRYEISIVDNIGLWCAVEVSE
jgi:hypothetical protein